MPSAELNPCHSNFEYHDSVPRVDFHTSRLHDFFRQHRSQTWHDHREKDVADAGVEDAFRGTACNKNIEKEWKRYKKWVKKGKSQCVITLKCLQFSWNSSLQTYLQKHLDVSRFTITGIAKRKNIKRPGGIRRSKRAMDQQNSMGSAQSPLQSAWFGAFLSSELAAWFRVLQ